MNKKPFRVCPDHITGNAVLVNKRKVTVEVLVLGEDRSIIRDKSEPEKYHYLYDGGKSQLYSTYNGDHRAIFNHYEKFFK